MSQSDKRRLDVLLVSRGLAPSRARAQRLIMAGAVTVDGRQHTKAGTPFPPSVELEVTGDPNPFVSRGGLKLEAALDAFQLDPTDLTALDIGASTGGFTDCLIKRGARKVFAVDVGYGQLDWQLRNDSRVTVMERTNARYLQPNDIAEPCQLAVIDVSFISLTKVVPAVVKLLSPNADLVCLVKPQFEAESRQVGKGGVIRDEKLRLEIIDQVVEKLEKLGLTVRGRNDSPIHGPKGNIECLVWLRPSMPVER